MDSCCESKQSELEALGKSHRTVLVLVFWINLSMFFIEGGFGLLAGSTSLLSDSADMFGDATIYGLSIWALGKSAGWNARISYFKGWIMLGLSVGIVVQALIRFFGGGIPSAETMGWVGATALFANLMCAVLLLKHRNDDINMRSTWLCTRNDVLNNLAVLVASFLVLKLESFWPDLIIGLGMATLFSISAFSILKESRSQL